MSILTRTQKLLEQMRRGETPFIGVGYVQEVEAALRAAHEPGCHEDGRRKGRSPLTADNLAARIAGAPHELAARHWLGPTGDVVDDATFAAKRAAGHAQLDAYRVIYFGSGVVGKVLTACPQVGRDE